MITENVSTLKIHKLTQEQYDRELAAGRIDETALYLTPDEEINTVIATDENSDGNIVLRQYIPEEDFIQVDKTLTIEGAAADAKAVGDRLDTIVNYSVFVTPEMYGAIGDGVTDDTKAWEDAVATGKRIVCEKGKTYVITSVGTTSQDNMGNAHLVLSAGQNIDFNGSTITWKHPTGTYRGLFVIRNVSNVELTNGVIIGDRESNATEFIHPIVILSSENVRISNMTIKETGGDGIVITEYLTNQVPCKNIEIANCHIYHAYRNALSIIMADGVEVHGCKFEYTKGTAPESGIDIEPNRYYQYCKNINVHHCSFIKNDNRGFLVTYHNNPAEIGVLLDSCYFESNDITDVSLSSGTTAGVAVDTTGYIDVRNCVAKYAGTNSIWINGHTSGKVRITFDDFTIVDCNQKGKTAIVSGASVYVNGYAEDDIAKNIYLKNIHVVGTTQTKELYVYYADIEYSGNFNKGMMLYSSTGSNAKVSALNEPVSLANTVGLDTFPLALYPSYIKKSDSTQNSRVNVGSLPSKLDIDFTNCSDYDIHVIVGSKTYIIPPNTKGKWVGEQKRVIGVKPTYTADEVGALPNTTTIPNKTSQLTNDSGFLTSIPSEYVTESELNAKGFLTQHQDLSGYAKKTDVPSKLSSLTNDIYNLVDVVATYEDGTTETLQLFVGK